MSLSLALQNALTGLEASQRALSVISHNVANANTEGYTRQVLDTSDVYYAGIGSGVRIDDVSRKIDAVLENAIQDQTSIVGRADVISEYLERAQFLFGEPGQTNSLDEYMNDFFNALQSLSEAPDSIAKQEVAVDTGVSLASEVSGLALSLEKLRVEADRDIQEAIRVVNEELLNLDNLNTAIVQAQALGNPISGLQDQQDRAIKTIAELIDVEVYLEDNNVIQVYTKSGLPLLDELPHEIEYIESNDIETFINDEPLNPIRIHRLDQRGNRVGDPNELVSGGTSDEMTTSLRHGKVKGLLDIRNEKLPQILEQLDELASKMRDAFNTIHNDGSSYPGTSSLTGTRELSIERRSDWTGSVQIAVLDRNGEPVPSQYSESEPDTGFRPLTMDLSELNSGFGNGQPDLQTIVNEINNHFFPPPVKTVLGNLANMQMVSVTDVMPQAPASFELDFDLENISGRDADFFVTGITVLDNTGADITSVSTPPPSVSLNTVNTFVTTNGSSTVTVNANSHGLSEGDRIYINDPGGAVNGIPATEFTNYFEITNVTTNSFEIEVRNFTATATGGVNIAGPLTAVPPWDTIAAGEKTRIRDTATVTLDLSGSASSPFYDVTFDIGVDDGTTTALAIPQSSVTYRIFNNLDDLRNDRYNSTAETGVAERIVPDTDQPYLTATLVDADGNEIASDDGNYIRDREGFLKLEAINSEHTIAIQELDSQETGISQATATTSEPEREGTNRGFSHYFGLNNFFAGNELTEQGDTLKNSAINLVVEERLEEDSSLISLGTLERTRQPADPDAEPIYTMERNILNNVVIEELAELGHTFQDFDAAGGIPNTRESFEGFSGQILAINAAVAVEADNEMRNQNILLEGYEERADAIGGVNIDEEMANTIVFQNAYSASARLISTTKELFEALLGAV